MGRLKDFSNVVFAGVVGIIYEDGEGRVFKRLK